MKRIYKKILCAALAATLVLNMSITSNAENLNDMTDITEVVESYLDELSLLNVSLTEYKENNLNHEYDDKIEEIKNEISDLHQKIEECGADTADDPLLQEVLTEAYYPTLQAGTRTTPDLSNLVSQLNGMYNVMGVQTTHSSGSDKYQLYDIYITYNDAKKGGIDLHRWATKSFYSSFSSGSSDATYYLNEIIKIYVQKAVSSALSYVPGANLVPWELFFSSKPSVSQISSSGNALLCTINSITQVKMTYVLDTNKDTWVLCASSNRVYADFLYTACLEKNGKPYSPQGKQSKTLDGGYNNSSTTAINTFKAMQSVTYQIAPANVGLSNVNYTSVYKGSVSVSIPNPSTPLGL